MAVGQSLEASAVYSVSSPHCHKPATPVLRGSGCACAPQDEGYCGVPRLIFFFRQPGNHNLHPLMGRPATPTALMLRCFGRRTKPRSIWLRTLPQARNPRPSRPRRGTLGRGLLRCAPPHLLFSSAGQPQPPPSHGEARHTRRPHAEVGAKRPSKHLPHTLPQARNPRPSRLRLRLRTSG